VLEELVQTLAANKKHLMMRITELREEIDPKKVNYRWVDYDPSVRENAIIGAEDGSYNVNQYQTFCLYAVAAKSFYYDGALHVFRNTDIDILTPYRHSIDRLRTYMSILEKKAALHVLNSTDAEVFLLDGSILGDLIRPATFDKAPSADVRTDIEQRFLPSITESLSNGEYEQIVSKNYHQELLEEGHSINSIVYLEYLENILCLREIIQHSSVVAVSKTSHSINYFTEYNVPDMAIFDLFCRSTGYSEPLKVELGQMERYKRRFPILDKYFRTIDLSLFYGRFGPNVPVLKFEYLGPARKGNAERILDSLSSSVVEGYPYLLKKAHNEVVIKKTHMTQIEKILGIYERTGREIL